MSCHHEALAVAISRWIGECGREIASLALAMTEFSAMSQVPKLFEFTVFFLMQEFSLYCRKKLCFTLSFSNMI
ncbi:MAG: hypothetical protein ABFC84_05245 [Veillonellales bacterium]